MRILCLHGQGTSAQLMKLQLGAFIRQVDDSYDFVFLEGEHECQAAPGVAALHEGPTYCFMEAVRPENVQNAIDQVHQFVEEEGPFDGMIGFSQGASLAVTYLLQEASGDIASDSDSGSDLGDTVSAFKWAVFLSAIPAFTPDATFCEDLLLDLNDDDRDLLYTFPYDNANIDFNALSGPPQRAVAFREFATIFNGCMAAGIVNGDYDHGFTELKTNIPGAEKVTPRIMHPDFLPPQTRIRIPTVHVVGAKDEPGLVASSRLMEAVCDTRLMQSLTHSGGHGIPSSWRDVRALVKAIERAVQDSILV